MGIAKIMIGKELTKGSETLQLLSPSSHFIDGEKRMKILLYCPLHSSPSPKVAVSQAQSTASCSPQEMLS